MIPHAIANSGPTAGLWSQFRSMQHAVIRAQTVDRAKDLHTLDKEHLKALVTLLQGESLRETNAPLSVDALHSADWEGNDVLTGMDVRQILTEMPEFRDWRAALRLGFDQKLKRLADAVAKYCEPQNELLNNPPKEELGIIHKLLTELVSQTELALPL